MAIFSDKVASAYYQYGYASSYDLVMDTFGPIHFFSLNALMVSSNNMVFPSGNVTICLVVNNVVQKQKVCNIGGDKYRGINERSIIPSHPPFPDQNWVYYFNENSSVKIRFIWSVMSYSPGLVHFIANLGGDIRTM